MRATLAATVAIGLATGCAGAHGDIVAPTAQFPISLSHSVRDGGGQIVGDTQLTVVGLFRLEKTMYALFYSALPVSGALDISNAVNEQVRAVRGDAVIDLRVLTKVCALDWLIPLNLLPVWPGCVTVIAQGTIVHVTSPHAARVEPSGR